jgi:AAA family ATP:ADP antiporter
VFSYTVIAQFWALAADLYTEEQGKRLFPVIGGGSSIGAVAGAALAKTLVPYGPHVLMAGALLILVFSATLVIWAGTKKRPANVRARSTANEKEEPLSNESALALLLGDKYLLLIGGMVICMNWVNSSGEYLLDRVLLAAAERARAAGTSPQEFVGAFKADYFAAYNLIGVLLQLFAVSRILKLVGVRRALFFMPAFALTAYGSALFMPVLAVMRLVKIGENSIQYSLQDTTRHALFLAANRAERFVGKTAIDTVAVRLGAIMAALTAFTATRLDWSTSVLAAINVTLSLLWIAFVIAIGREHTRRTEGAAPLAAPAAVPGS